MRRDQDHELPLLIPPGIPESEVRIYRTTVILGDLSSPEYKMMGVAAKTPIPVYSEDGLLLGHAGIRLVNRKLVADIAIDYACEERLLAETGAERLWAWLVGELKIVVPLQLGLGPNGSAGIDLSIPLRGSYLHVEEIIINHTPPHDQRMGRFGEPVLL